MCWCPTQFKQLRSCDLPKPRREHVLGHYAEQTKEELQPFLQQGLEKLNRTTSSAQSTGQRQIHMYSTAPQGCHLGRTMDSQIGLRHDGHDRHGQGAAQRHRSSCRRRRGSCPMHSFQQERSLTLIALSWALLCGLSEAFLPQQVPIRIDCGAESGSTDAQGLVWQADAFYANGTAQAVQPMYSAGGSLAAVDSTLRAWTTGDSCYHVPVAPGRYLVRLSFAYNNFDDNYYNLLTSNKLPTVGVSINGYYVEHVGMSMINVTGYYTDYVAYSEADAKSAPDEIVGAAEAAAGGAGVEWVHVCLEPEQGSPYVNSLQVLPVDTDSYYAATTGSQVALSNWVRINAGGGALGPEVAGDPGYRTWNPDQPASASFDPWTLVQTSGGIDIPESLAPLNLPTTLFQTARKAGNPLKSTGYNFTGIFPVDPSHRFMVVLYFAEIEDNVQAGDRVMDIWVNGETVNKLDVIANAGAPNTALVLHLSVVLGGDISSPVGQWIGVLLRPSAAAMQPPIISGVEIYEIIPLRVAPAITDPDGSAAVAVRVDCGGHYNYTDSFGFTWSADYGYSSGAPSIVLAPGNEFEHARSIRYYPEEGSNCYDVPVPPGRYLVRMFFDYGNYDGLNQVPTFFVAVEGTLLVAVAPAAPGGYEDVVATVNDGAASVCVLADVNSPHPTLISSIEVLEIDGKAYLPTELTASKTLGGGSGGAAAILYDHVRVNSGGVVFGEGLTADLERGHRQWLGDTNTSLFGVACSPACFQVALPDSVEPSGADEAPEFVPPTLFRTARTASRLGPSTASSVTYTFSNIRAGATVLVYLHLMEVSPGARVGSRVFSVFANGLLVDKLSNIDLMASVGRYAAKSESFLLKLGTEQTGVEVELRSEKGATLGPAVSGVELYVVLPRSPAVPATTLSAMHALRDSMRVPESAHWQGDPCAPVEWYGVNCTNVTAPNNPSVVVARQVVSISLNNVGFNGTIPEAIGNLTALTLLSLSGNGLIGSIPQSITALKNLVSLDLSKNQLNGSIPDGLSSMPSLHLLLLNDNLLMGVPEGLVPAPPGIAVNLQGNPYLCGADGYPSCNSIVFPPPPGTGGVTAVPLDAPPSSGGSSSTNVGAIVGIVIGVVAVLAAVVILAVVLWRRQQQRKQLERAESQQYALGTPTKHTPGCMGFHEKGYCEVVPEDSAPYL